MVFASGDNFILLCGKSENLLASLPDNSADSIVTDPPYELGFMGKAWDSTGIAYNVAFWRECLRVLKPGGHLLAFGGSRTYHRLACAVEDAGFEIRDQIQWVYGSGFPKSMDVSKAIDKAAGAEREVIGVAGKSGSKRSCMAGDFTGGEYMETAPATPAAKQWSGWGTALKPAHEPIVVARKPLSEGTVAANVLRWGTGGLNVDGCRIDGQPWKSHTATGLARDKFFTRGPAAEIEKHPHAQGRFPANLIHDGSDEVLAGFPESKGQQGDVRGNEPSHTGDENSSCYGVYGRVPQPKRGDSGSAARFFYCAKASKAERNGSKHPTVKPLALMRYLCRLVTPPGGTVLDPFAGSGTTLEAAILEGFECVGIELMEDHCEDIVKRLTKGT